jgi:ElaB/YqjD/DUF883 family membrane-anchored ribosome-binding protein
MATRNTGGSEGTQPPTLREQAAELGRQAGRGARQVATEAQSQAESRLDRGRHEAAVTLSSVASRLRESGSQLRGADEQDFAGEYVQRASEQIERFAKYVENAEVREVVDRVEDFARRRPAVFIGTAFAAGILAARFLRSSRDEQLHAQGHLLDREVTSPVARETGRSYPPSNPWREPL